MKKVACTVLLLTLAIFLINPLSSESRWGYWGWWAPWAVIGGAAVMAPYYSSYYYYPYYSPYYYSPYYYAPPREQLPAYFQLAPSVQPSTAERLFIYPRKGQTEKLQAKDTYECHNWAVGQTNYDPTQPPGGVPSVQKGTDYNRAINACLDARGYTAK